jgi:hypothetical protein
MRYALRFRSRFSPARANPCQGGRLAWLPTDSQSRFAPALLASIMPFLLSVAPPLAAQTDAVSVETSHEYEIKAAFLYNFGRYVEWPAASFHDANSPFVIGVLGKDPFGAVLDEIAGSKKVDGRRIVVRRFTAMAEYQTCHILFVAAEAAPEQKVAAMAMARSSPVLLVGEENEFNRHGGVIRLFVEENKIRFEVNVVTAKQKQLKISSKLLSLAKITEQK